MNTLWVLLLFFLGIGLWPQSSNPAGEDFQIIYAPGEKYRITEISNFRQSVNNKYTGFISRQIRGIMEVTGRKNGQSELSGTYYVMQESKHDSRFIANSISKTEPSRFVIASNGQFIVPEGVQYPLTRSFPVFPKDKLNPGDKWQAFGERYVDPLNKGIFTRVQFYCDYQFMGEKEYEGVEAYLINAQYALRYKGDDPKGDPKLKAITNGGHKVEIYVSKNTGRPLFMRDLIIENLGGEVYLFTDNSQMVLKGFTQTWFDLVEIMNRDKILEEIDTDIVKNIPDVTVENSDQGVKLTLNNLRFVADQDILLAGENSKLDQIAAALKKIPDRSFMVVGHTAYVGTEESMYDLSVKRAKKIVDMLVERGIDAKNFLYQGKGGSDPVALNDTEENKAKNRRVEIIIMED